VEVLRGLGFVKEERGLAHEVARDPLAATVSERVATMVMMMLDETKDHICLP
jgi:hypothetical protein